MPKPRDRAAARATPESSCRKPQTDTRGALALSAAVTSRGAKSAALNEAMSESGPDADLLALLVTLNQQHEIIADIEAEKHHLPAGITDASRDQERRLEHAMDRRTETLHCVIAAQASTPDGLRGKAGALCLVALGCAVSHEGEALEEIAYYGDAWNLALSLACDVLTWDISARAGSPISNPRCGELNTIANLTDRLRAALPGPDARPERAVAADPAAKFPLAVDARGRQR